MAENNGAPSRAWPRRQSPYRQWQKGEGLPVYEGSYVGDLYHLDVRPWPRMGQKGAFVNLAAQEQDDAYVLEIAPGGQTEVQHHLFEATVLVLEGRGATTFWQPGSGKQTLEWQRGSVFSPPLNCYYQHFNGDGQKPARLFAVTIAPMMMNLMRNTDFIFNDTYVFRDRFDASDDYFSDAGHRDTTREREWVTNFIPDIRAFRLDENDPRGLGSLRLGFTFSGNQMVAHSSQWPPGTYLKGHRHGVGAHVLILDGQGYSLLWFEGEARRKVDWQDGSVLSPKENEYHQHFNSGPTPVRYFAFRLGAADTHRVPQAPDQIESEHEDPAIYELYERECATNGVKVTLPRPAYARR
jgi:quercetin dioxygenase-like cupin family protein